ncbi:ATP-binding protein (plasmid) [Aneurinibacillus sp. Ricciae_BoGa-3]|uniref:ATP-binding protein n=1 Tax=Aneurinibacillus sp. Ricciae_BoGa-3 TaxID=3022697 RepID=UPI0023411A1A|nr:ATP-binding protein [Aneurinibacillus sp. Ricciae_BoGa-3]WCK56989.1 ATP-binding protein [Aneurinibacillus sp. Ricciae_BoGa-3]
MKTEWIETLKEKYHAGISNLFMITGNIGDYAVPGIMFMDYLVQELSQLGMEKIITYDYSAGSVYRVGNELEEGEERQIVSDWLQMVEDLQNTDGKVAYIIEYPEFLVPNANNGYIEEDTKKRLIDLHKVINSRDFLFSNNILIFVTEVKSSINSMFISSNARTVPIEIDYPKEEERYAFIQHLKSTSQKPVRFLIDEKKFAKLTAGLSRVNIEDIYLLAEDKGVLDKDSIMERKKELIYKEFGEIIEIYDTEGYSLDNFAGQEHIKSYHREVVIDPILEGDTTIVPKGLLYMGPPGTGKTYFSKCLAGDANINFVEFKMSKILGKYVSESERNLEKAMNCFRSLAPVGVFIDEVDQVLSRGDSDSNSVTKNLFGMFLAFLSEPSHRGKILWIGATNYPNKLDEALKRAGRFDKKIPFLPPTAEERKGVFAIHLAKTNFPYHVTDYTILADKTENYTQAEIENVVVKALEVAKRRKSQAITDEILLYAIDCMISAQNDNIQEMTDISLNECNDREFLPVEYRKKTS